MARITFVDKNQAAQEVADLFAKMESRGTPIADIWKISARVPATLPHFIRMANALISKTKLDPKLRELAILRVTGMLGCETERNLHVSLAKSLGLSDEQAEVIADWERASTLNGVERAVLRFTDEVAQNGRVRDETFSDLAAYLDEDMLVELAQVIGFYEMISKLLLCFELA